MQTLQIILGVGFVGFLMWLAYRNNSDGSGNDTDWGSSLDNDSGDSGDSGGD